MDKLKTCATLCGNENAVTPLNLFIFVKNNLRLLLADPENYIDSLKKYFTTCIPGHSVGDIIRETNVKLKSSAKAALKHVDEFWVNADLVMRELDCQDKVNFYVAMNKENGAISKVAKLQPEDGFIAAVKTASEVISVSKFDVFKKFRSGRKMV